MLNFSASLFYTLGDAPNSQLEKSVADRFKVLEKKIRTDSTVSVEIIREELKQIIGDCIDGGLASTFVMILLNREYKRLGGTEEIGKIIDEEI
jgi:hypothetical protein